MNLVAEVDDEEVSADVKHDVKRYCSLLFAASGRSLNDGGIPVLHNISPCIINMLHFFYHLVSIPQGLLSPRDSAPRGVVASWRWWWWRRRAMPWWRKM